MDRRPLYSSMSPPRYLSAYSNLMLSCFLSKALTFLIHTASADIYTSPTCGTNSQFPIRHWYRCLSLEPLKSSTSDARSLRHKKEALDFEFALMRHMLNAQRETICIPWLTAWLMESSLVLVMPRSTRKSTASFATKVSLYVFRCHLRSFTWTPSRKAFLQSSPRSS
jgi:hypothetical protein